MIIPLTHIVIVKPHKFTEVNKDIQRAKDIGLVIPELEDMKRAQASVDSGTVVSIGSTAYRDYGIDPPITVGDVVNYARFSGKLITDPESGEEFVALNDQDLICIIKENHE